VDYHRDLFGSALLDWAKGGHEPDVIERRDGYCEFGGGHASYLATPHHWPTAERRALTFISGRVLDVGSGAGRVSLELQRRGLDVVALDASPGAVRAAKLRGVTHVLRASVNDLDAELSGFGSVVLFGNNFGMLGSPSATRAWLRRWARRSGPDTRIFAESTNPYCGGAPGITRRQYFSNKALDRPPGQVTLRYRYRGQVGPWFPWLFVSQHDMAELLKGTGWRVTEVVTSKPSEPYVAILEKA
jgi:SAM-dependent methyltransferase